MRVSILLIAGSAFFNSSDTYFYRDNKGRKVEIGEEEYNKMSKSDKQMYEQMVVNSPKSQTFTKKNRAMYSE